MYVVLCYIISMVACVCVYVMVLMLCRGSYKIPVTSEMTCMALL